MARTTAGLLLSSHPGPVLAVSGGVSAIAWSAGRGPAGTAWSGLAVLAGQMSIGFSNDYLDRAADLAAGRRDKPVALGRVPAGLVAATALITLAFSAAFSMACGWRAGLVQLATVAAGWVYNLGLKRTVWSVVPFIPGFGLFPAFVTLGLPGHPWPAWWATTGGALLGMGAHFANVLPDLPADLATGVRGLPQRLGGRISRAVAGLLLGAATAVLALGPGNVGAMPVALRWAGVAVAAVVAGAGVMSALAGRSGAANPGQAARYMAMLAVIGAGLFDVLLLVARGGHIA